MIRDRNPPNSLLICPNEDSYGYLESKLLGDRALFLLEGGVKEAQLKYLKLESLWENYLVQPLGYHMVVKGFYTLN